jgi:hypothetical protein
VTDELRAHYRAAAADLVSSQAPISETVRRRLLDVAVRAKARKAA